MIESKETKSQILTLTTKEGFKSSFTIVADTVEEAKPKLRAVLVEYSNQLDAE